MSSIKSESGKKQSAVNSQSEKELLLKPDPPPRIFLSEDLLNHSSSTDCWVSLAGKVYDISSFLPDHPGGDELLLRYAGKDLGDAMEDPVEHSHSKAAYEMLSEFQIGIIGTPETILNPNLIIDDDFKPTKTDLTKDFARNQFLDLTKPLIAQMWNCRFSKSFYLQQVHQPRHLSKPARLFGPWYLEMFTRTSWYVVPMIWLPIAIALFHRSLQQLQLDHLYSLPTSWSIGLGCFLFGNFVWTLLEYVLHRFLFHIDELLPDRPFFLLLHFLLHGVHHYLPMDRLRLVMPPILFALLSHPFTRLAYFLFPVAHANAVIAGSFTFYVLYDCTHYALHHTQLPSYVKEMKIYHMAHHFKDADLGFGVTSKIWDYVFGTVLPVR